MNYWLLKSEPSTYSWDDLMALGCDHWDGVRNYTARNNMQQMSVGDWCLFYHSVKEKSIVGIVEVVRESYPDPTTDDTRWCVVDVVPIRKMKRAISLSEVKADGRLTEMELLKNSRLSVQRVLKEEFEIIMQLSKT